MKITQNIARLAGSAFKGVSRLVVRAPSQLWFVVSLGVIAAVA